MTDTDPPPNHTRAIGILSAAYCGSTLVFKEGSWFVALSALAIGVMPGIGVAGTTASAVCRGSTTCRTLR